jgi:ubiquinol-cytochrome c reductase cytochrome b subunit
MAEFVTDSFADLDEDGQAQLDDLIVALSAQAALPAQETLDAEADKSGQIERGIEAFAYSFDGGSCVDCHKMGDEDPEYGAPDLTGYGSREWLIQFLSDPSHSRFYGEGNDRMPSFAKDAAQPENNLLDRQSLELLVDWLRGDWYEAAQTD